MFWKAASFASSKWRCLLLLVPFERVLSVQKRCPGWIYAKKTTNSVICVYICPQSVISWKYRFFKLLRDLKKTDQRFTHKVFAADNYYERTMGRFETKSIEADKGQSFLENNIGKAHTWFWKVFCAWLFQHRITTNGGHVPLKEAYATSSAKVTLVLRWHLYSGLMSTTRVLFRAKNLIELSTVQD